MNKENIHFKIGLSRSTEKKQPAFNIFVNNTNYVSASLSNSVNTVEYFEFSAEVYEGECELIVEFVNKTDLDTVHNINGDIVDDMLLNINSVEIDEINLGSLIWTHSIYKPKYSNSYKKLVEKSGNQLPELVKNCVNLGWNGTWSLPFQSPFYIWLLENL